MDAMAQRYSVLPSELLAKGDTFDVTVMDVALSYQNFKEKGKDPEALQEMYGQEQLEEIMKRTRGE